MYSKQANSLPFGATRPSGEAVRLAVGDGTWMSIQQATIVTGLTERTLRRHIKKGWLKYRRNGKRTNSPLELWITPDVSKFVEHEDSDDSEVVEIFNAEPDDTYDEIVETGPEATPQNQQAQEVDGSARRPSEIESVLQSITGQFLQRLDQSNEMIFQLRSELQDKDRQLKLLPDLQKEANDKQLAELKSIALEKQIEELKLVNEKLQLEAEAATEKARLAQQKRGWWSWLMGSNNSSTEPTT
jgi:hypothetical protein